MNLEIETINQLVETANAVQTKAYAPYSSYHVGSAILGSNGKIYAGCNVENASYGLTICAERNAVCQMIADGCQSIKAVVVKTRNGGSPCGACRQVLAEFGDYFPVIFLDEAQNRTTTTMKALLPSGFDKGYLDD